MISTVAHPASSRTDRCAPRISDVGPNPEPFAPIPHRVRDDIKAGKLKLGDHAILAELLAWARNRTTSDVTVGQVAEALGIGERAVQFALARLETAGWIRRERDSSSRVVGQRKVLAWRAASSEGVHPTTPPGEPACAPGRKPVHHPAHDETPPGAHSSAPSKEGSSKKFRDVVETAARTNNTSARTLPEPEPTPKLALQPDGSTVDMVLNLATGADPASLDRAAHAIVVDLKDDLSRLGQHRANLIRIARGDRLEVLRVLTALSAGRRAGMKGLAAGKAFAVAYMGFAQVDPAQIEAAILQAVEGLRALDQAAHQAEAAIAERARLQALERSARAEGERRRGEARRALRTLVLPPGAGPREIVAALASVGLTLTAHQLPGLRPCLSLGDVAGLSDLPAGARDVIERNREGLARFMESKTD